MPALGPAGGLRYAEATVRGWGPGLTAGPP